jgi:DNA-binding Xre family transcriptional regulator
MEITSKQEVFQVLNDIDPAEASKLKPFLISQYKERAEQSAKAEAEVVRCKAACDEDDAVLKFMLALQAQKTGELSEATGVMRLEIYALRESFALEAQASRLDKLCNAVAYLDSEYDYLLSVKRGADEILFLDALEQLALCKALEGHSAAQCSHVATVASLGPVYEAEGGIGLIGARTETLRAEAAAADQRYESSKLAAREARGAYQRQQSARISTGLITRGGR